MTGGEAEESRVEEELGALVVTEIESGSTLSISSTVTTVTTLIFI